MSATLTTDEVWQAFLGHYAESRTFFHGHTYGGNPLAAAVALASWMCLKRSRRWQNLPDESRPSGRALARIAAPSACGRRTATRSDGRVELVRDRETREPYPWAERRGQRVCDVALRHGVWLRPLGNVVVIMPPLGDQPGGTRPDLPGGRRGDCGRTY